MYSFRLKRQCWKFKNYQLDTGVPIGRHVAATPVELARHLGESVLQQTEWSTRRTDVLDDGLDFRGGRNSWILSPLKNFRDQLHTRHIIDFWYEYDIESVEM